MGAMKHLNSQAERVTMTSLTNEYAYARKQGKAPDGMNLHSAQTNCGITMAQLYNYFKVTGGVANDGAGE